MTATDELRRQLDERGVEHEGDERSVRWRDRNGVMMQAFPLANGELGMEVWSCTPEQAIAATMWAGTCHADETETWQGVCMSNPIRYVHNLTIHVMECSACGGTYEYVNGSYEFCPRCGRRVVE